MPVTDELLAAAAGLSSATVHEAAGRVGALPGRLGPVDAGMRVCGRAYPVRSPAGDNLWLHRAIYAAAPGDVLVVEVGPGAEHGYWGEIMSEAAKARPIGGLVLDGGVRDADQLCAIGFPVFSSGLCIKGTGKDPHGDGSLGGPVCIGGVVIHSGDLVIGDRDGVVVIAGADAEAAIAASFERDAKEALIITRLRAGESTIDIYKLP